MVEAELPGLRRSRAREPRRALARRRGALGRRAAGETWEEEELDRGYAPWEVRVQCASRQEAQRPRRTARGGGLPAGPPVPLPHRRRRLEGGGGRARGRVCTAASSRAATSSGRPRPAIPSPSSAASASSRAGPAGRLTLPVAPAMLAEAALAQGTRRAAPPLEGLAAPGACCAHARSHSSADDLCGGGATRWPPPRSARKRGPASRSSATARIPRHALAPGTARRRALDDATAEIEAGRRAPEPAVEGSLRADARARARARRAGAAHDGREPRCAATRSTRSPECSPS